MTLLPNWWDILKKAWSVRLLVLAALLSGLEVALPLFDLMILPPGVLAALSFAVTAAAFIARIMAQRNLSGGC